MAKFNLKHAKKEAKQEAVLEQGCHRVMITQVAEVGMQRSFNQGDDTKESIGLCFENGEGLQITKVMTLSVSSYSNFIKVLSACDEVEELDQLLGKQLDLEIEGNGQYPKIVGYYHLEDGMSGQSEILETNTLFYSVEDPESESLKQLHPNLKQAISMRVRSKK